MNDEIQPPTAAVVGLGRMGLRHLQVLCELGMKISGLSDINRASAIAAGQSYAPEAAIYENAADMLQDRMPEAVVIATTADSHKDLVLAAVGNGAKWILCEKPMAVSLEEANSMTAACAEAGVKLAINHQMRFMPNYFRIKELIGTEGLGALASIVVSGSNFGLAMNASHFFEVFRYITDENATVVFADFEDDIVANPRGPQFEDRSGRLIAKNSNGQAIYIDFSVNAGWGLSVAYICRYGQIHVDELGGEVRVYERQPEYRDLPTTRYGMPHMTRIDHIPPTDATAPTRALWDAMLNDRDFPGASEGRHALECIIAAHLSHEQGGKWVSLASLGRRANQKFNWA